jgi:hypothetical protein
MKSQITINSDKDGEKSESSYTVSEKIRGCSHFGKEPRSFSTY